MKKVQMKAGIIEEAKITQADSNSSYEVEDKTLVELEELGWPIEELTISGTNGEVLRQNIVRIRKPGILGAAYGKTKDGHWLTTIAVLKLKSTSLEASTPL
jgi:hypothetical protein